MYVQYSAFLWFAPPTRYAVRRKSAVGDVCVCKSLKGSTQHPFRLLVSMWMIIRWRRYEGTDGDAKPLLFSVDCNSGLKHLPWKRQNLQVFQTKCYTGIVWVRYKNRSREQNVFLEFYGFSLKRRDGWLGRYLCQEELGLECQSLNQT